MQTLANLLVFLAFWLTSVTGVVHELGDDDFDSQVLASGSWFVEFFAPWCGHCKALAPVYLNASVNPALTGKVSFASVDTTANRQLADRFEVNRFPTIFFFENGEQFEYNGPRTEEGFVHFGLQMQNEPLQSLGKSEMDDFELTEEMSFLCIELPSVTDRDSAVFKGRLKTALGTGMKSLRPWVSCKYLDGDKLQNDASYKRLKDTFEIPQKLIGNVESAGMRQGSLLFLAARSKYDLKPVVSIVDIGALSTATEPDFAEISDEISRFFARNVFGALTRFRNSATDEKPGALKGAVMRNSDTVVMVVTSDESQTEVDASRSLVRKMGALSAAHSQWRSFDSGSQRFKATFAVAEYKAFKGFLSERFGISSTDELPLVVVYLTEDQAYFKAKPEEVSAQLIGGILSGDKNGELTHVNTFLVRGILFVEKWLNSMKPWQMILFFGCIFVSIFGLMIAVDYCCTTRYPMPDKCD